MEFKKWRANFDGKGTRHACITLEFPLDTQLNLLDFHHIAPSGLSDVIQSAPVYLVFWVPMATLSHWCRDERSTLTVGPSIGTVPFPRLLSEALFVKLSLYTC